MNTNYTDGSIINPLNVSIASFVKLERQQKLHKELKRQGRIHGILYKYLDEQFKTPEPVLWDDPNVSMAEDLRKEEQRLRDLYDL